MKINRYEQQVGLQTPAPKDQRVTAAPNSGLVGAVPESQVGVSKAVGGIADKLTGYILDDMRQEADKEVARADADITEKLQSVLLSDKTDDKGSVLGLLRRQGDNAKGSVTAFDAQFKALEDSHLGKMKGDYQRDALAKRLTATRLSHREAVIGHEVTQKQAAFESDKAAEIANHVNATALVAAALPAAQPGLLALELKKGEDISAPLFARRGLGEEARKLETQKNSAEIFKTVLQASAVKNAKPEEMQSLLKTAMPHLSDEAKSVFQNAINGHAVDKLKEDAWTAVLKTPRRADNTYNTDAIPALIESKKNPDGTPLSDKQKQEVIRDAFNRSSVEDSQNREALKAVEYKFWGTALEDKAAGTTYPQAVAKVSANTGNFWVDSNQKQERLNDLAKLYGENGSKEGRMKSMNDDQIAAWKLIEIMVDGKYPRDKVGKVAGYGSSDVSFREVAKEELLSEVFKRSPGDMLSHAQKQLEARPNLDYFGIAGLFSDGQARVISAAGNRMVSNTEMFSMKAELAKKNYSPAQIDDAFSQLASVAPVKGKVPSINLVNLEHAIKFPVKK